MVLTILGACGAEQFRGSPGGGSGGATLPPTGTGGNGSPGTGGGEGTGSGGAPVDADDLDAPAADADPPPDVPVTSRDLAAETMVCTTDIDNDGVDDCTEDNDGDPFTDRAAFNGMSVTVKANGSTGTCADLADYNRTAALFQTPTETRSMYAGWSFDTDEDRYYAAAYGFKPNWTTMAAGAFRVRYRGVINLKVGGQHCFKVDIGSTGGADPDACGQIYVDSGPGKKWLVQNGNTALAAESQACLTLAAGSYPFDVVFQYGNANHHHKLAVLYCAGGGSACTPTQALTQQMVRPPSCISTADCTCEFFGGHAYRFCKTGRSFTSAAQSCTTQSMHLIRIDNAAENQWAYDVIRAEGIANAWIGATDSPTESDWRWADGTSFWTGLGAITGGKPVGGLFNAWDAIAQEPNQNGDEDCAGFWYPTRSTWADLTCTDPLPYICESN